MPRSLRIHVPGAFLHVIARGNRRMPILDDDPSRVRFLRLLRVESRRAGCELHAYCLMTNHLHLLMRVGNAPLGEVMRPVLSRFAEYRNRRFCTDGHIFQGRYKAIACHDEMHILTVLRYIHRNPVKAGMVADPGEWPWSSHNAYLSRDSALVETAFCLALLGEETQVYREFLLDDSAPLWPHDTARIPDGVLIEGPLEPAPHSRKVAVDLKQLAEAIATRAGFGMEAVVGPGRTRVLATVRRKIAIEAWKAGYALAEVAELLGRSRQAMSKAIRLVD